MESTGPPRMSTVPGRSSCLMQQTEPQPSPTGVATSQETQQMGNPSVGILVVCCTLIDLNNALSDRHW
jgi:hypothetical protein